MRRLAWTAACVTLVAVVALCLVISTLTFVTSKADNCGRKDVYRPCPWTLTKGAP